MKLLTTITLLLIGYFAHSQVIYCQGIEYNDHPIKTNTVIDIASDSIGYWTPDRGIHYEQITDEWRDLSNIYYLTDYGTVVTVQIDKVLVNNPKRKYSMVFYKDMERERIKRYIE